MASKSRTKNTVVPETNATHKIDICPVGISISSALCVQKMMREVTAFVKVGSVE